MRTKLFISHATPTDNKFAAWLAARLELHGYEVWVDIRTLDPAVDFWNTIETTIREDTVKFLFIATKVSVLGNRDGIKKELAVADRVRKVGLPDFIVPLRVDDVSFDDFPVEIVRLNGIDFKGDWGDGLVKLLEYLDKQGIEKTTPPSAQMDVALKRWKTATESNSVVSLPKSDDYYSNLFPITLPDFMYVYDDTKLEDSLKKQHRPYKKSGFLIITLVCPDCMKNNSGIEANHQAVNVRELLENNAEAVIFGFPLRNLRNDLVNLVNWELGELLYQNGLRRYKPVANRHSKSKYFFRRGTKSKRHEQSRPKSLSGGYKGKYWHFAQSAFYTEFPIEGVIFRSHLLFTEGNDEPFPDALQIKARRSKGKLFFNNDWRNLLQAAMFSHAKGADKIIKNICCENNQLAVRRDPYVFSSDKGYIEPSVEPTELFKEVLADDDE